MNIALISHVSVGYAPTYPFEKFLLTKDKELDTVFHPLVDSGINRSVMKCGKIEKKQVLYDRPVRVIDYLRHFVLSVWWIMKTDRKYDVMVTMGNLNVISGLVLRMLGKTDNIIYYASDYSTNRFDNTLLNFIYASIDKIAVNNANYILSVSNRILDVRHRQGVPKHKNLLQSNGVHLAQIKKNRTDKRRSEKKYKMIFSGHITKSKGIDMIIDSIYEDKHKYIYPMTLDIYGDGTYIDVLKDKVEKFKLTDYIFFKGFVTNDIILENLNKYDIGIATYTSEDDFNNYCDPVKVKEYLAANLVVVISNVPEISRLISENDLGIEINNTKQSISQALILLSSGNTVDHIRSNYGKIDLDLDWDCLFEKTFKVYSKKL